MVRCREQAGIYVNDAVVDSQQKNKAEKQKRDGQRTDGRTYALIFASSRLKTECMPED